MTNPLALITGASSGIGRELAQVFAANGYDLAVTARRAEMLEAIRGEVDTEVTVLPMDLTKASSASLLMRELEGHDLQPDVLVNNAGIAHHGEFASMSATAVSKLVNLNVRAVAELTQRLLPGMLERKRGHILNVASIVGFQAVPGMALYAATKAFVISFSEALSEELQNTGVSVTALCPGLTDTDMGDQFKASGIPSSVMSSVEEVAREGYRGMIQREPIKVPGILNQALVGWLSLQPRWLVRSLSGMAARMNFAADRDA